MPQAANPQATGGGEPPLSAISSIDPDTGEIAFSSLLQEAFGASADNKQQLAESPTSSTARSDLPVVLPGALVTATANSSNGGVPMLAAVGRACYSHAAMVELMVTRPDYTHAMLCAHFARPASWLPSILASEAFQQALDPYRNQIVDPSLTATLHERYKALAIRTSNVMMQKMDDDKCTDFLVLKAGEIAMKALGMGTKTEAAPPPAAAPATTDSLAERLMAALDRRDNARTVDAVTDSDDEQDSPHGNV